MEIQRYYERIAEITLEMIVFFDGQGKILTRRRRSLAIRTGSLRTWRLTG